MNIRVDLTNPIIDGTEVVFRSPVDCSQITGLIVYYGEDSKEFALADAHGNNVGDIDHLFAENVVVKVILDVTNAMAYVQNADTNAYIESTFVKSVNGVKPDKTGNVDVVGGNEPCQYIVTIEPNEDGTYTADATADKLNAQLGKKILMCGYQGYLLPLKLVSDGNYYFSGIVDTTSIHVVVRSDGSAGVQERTLAQESEVPKHTLRYTPQDLTPEQQAQARENIGVADLPAGGGVSVFKGRTASFYGDSLTEINSHYTKGYHKWLSDALGLASYNNYGVSGYKVSDVYNKVNSVNDTADIIFVMCGVNDQTFSVPLGTMGDTTSDTTYGALDMLCALLKQKYPTKLVVFITPHYQTKYPHSEGITSYEVAKAVREVCEKYAIPVYDNFALSGIYQTNLTAFTTDNCHWNDTAHEMVGKNLSKFMLNTFGYLYGVPSVDDGGNGGNDENGEGEGASFERYLTIDDIESSVGATNLTVDITGTIEADSMVTWTIVKLTPSIVTIKGICPRDLYLAYKDNGDGTFECCDGHKTFTLTAGSGTYTENGELSLGRLQDGEELTLTLANNTLTLSNGIVIQNANMIGFWGSAANKSNLLKNIKVITNTPHGTNDNGTTFEVASISQNDFFHITAYVAAEDLPKFNEEALNVSFDIEPISEIQTLRIPSHSYVFEVDVVNDLRAGYRQFFSYNTLKVTNQNDVYTISGITVPITTPLTKPYLAITIPLNFAVGDKFKIKNAQITHGENNVKICAIGGAFKEEILTTTDAE